MVEDIEEVEMPCPSKTLSVAGKTVQSANRFGLEGFLEGEGRFMFLLYKRRIESTGQM
jgi:hypothetical protein